MIITRQVKTSLYGSNSQSLHHDSLEVPVDPAETVVPAYKQQEVLQPQQVLEPVIYGNSSSR